MAITCTEASGEKDMKNGSIKQPTGSKFLEILSRVDKEFPSEQDLEEVKKYLTENNNPLISDDPMPPVPGDLRPSPTRKATEVILPLKRLSQHLISNQISKTFSTSKELREHLATGAEELRNELGYMSSSMIEQLLIDEIILEFLRSHQMQLFLTELTSRPGTQLLTIKKISDLASAAQNRFNKAVQMLAKLRKAEIKLQINIATEGGRQVNLQR